MEPWLLPFGPSTSVDTSSLCPRFDVLGETFFLGIGNDNHLFFLGTLAPFLRASERPIAIACLRLLTFPPRPLLPERRVVAEGRSRVASKRSQLDRKSTRL